MFSILCDKNVPLFSSHILLSDRAVFVCDVSFEDKNNTVFFSFVSTSPLLAFKLEYIIFNLSIILILNLIRVASNNTYIIFLYIILTL